MITSGRTMLHYMDYRRKRKGYFLILKIRSLRTKKFFTLEREELRIRKLKKKTPKNQTNAHQHVL